MKYLIAACSALVVAATIAGCSGGSGSSGSSGTVPVPVPTATLTPSPVPTPSAAPTIAAGPVPAQLVVQGGFYAETIAHVPQARQMAALPNGDLLVGTLANAGTVYIVPGAENAGGAQAASVFATVPDTKAHSVVYSPQAGAIFIATTNHVYKVVYHLGDRTAQTAPASILNVRTGGIPPNSDGDVHTTTSLAATTSGLYVSVGSSCNACTEIDPTRAAILTTDFNGVVTGLAATRVRNAIALAVNPVSQAVWIAGAGQDCLPQGTPTCGSQNDAYFTGRPFEWVDNLSGRNQATVDYQWPQCEENQRDRHSFNPLWTTSDCSHAPIPQIEFPTYSTHIGLAVYPTNQTGAYAFPAAYRGLYVGSHGSWHESASGIPIAVPDVAFVRLSGDAPTLPVNFSNPGAQWNSFFGNFQDTFGSRVGQPSGITVGAAGSLFVADDAAGVVYRLRAGLAPASILHRAR